MEPRNLVEVANRHLDGAFPGARRGYYDSASRQVRWVAVADMVREAFGFARRLSDALPRRESACLLHDLEPRAQSTAILAAMAAGSAPLVLPRNALDRGTDAFVDWVRATFDTPPLLVSESLRDLPESLPVADGSPAATSSEQSDRAPYPVGDLAFLQCTSATTGSAKVACIGHDNVLRNVRGIREHVGGGDHEVVCSWLPLYHDMGLVGCELFSLVHGYEHVSLRAYDFLRRPSAWLRLVGEFRCTMSPAPNFGYQYAADHVRSDELEGIDLGSWQVAFNGAEPVRVSTMRAFVDRFAPFGFRKEAFCASYGLAEATLAVCLSHPEPARYLVIDRETVKPGAAAGIRRSGSVFEATAPAVEKNELIVTSCGRPLSAVSLALDAGGVASGAAGMVGEIVVRGPSVFRGYLAREDGSSGGELHTGDLGFLHDGELYVVDRLKNIVIINGLNYPTSDLEERVGRVLQVPPEGVMVFERSIGGEASSVVAIVEADPGAGPIAEDAAQALSGLLGQIVFVKRRSLPKTTSGKKQHHLARSLLAAGQLPVIKTTPLR